MKGEGGKHLRSLPLRFSHWSRLVSLSNMPAGRLLRLLFCSCSHRSLVSLSNMPAGKLLRLLLSSLSDSRLVSLSNMPVGKLLRLPLSSHRYSRLVRLLNAVDGRLLGGAAPKRFIAVRLVNSPRHVADGKLLKPGLRVRLSHSRLVRLSNTPDGRLLRLLLYRYSLVKPARSSKMPDGRLLRLLLYRCSLVKPARSSKSPAFRAVRDSSFTTSRIVIPASSAAVTLPQSASVFPKVLRILASI